MSPRCLYRKCSFPPGVSRAAMLKARSVAAGFNAPLNQQLPEIGSRQNDASGGVRTAF